MITGPACHHLGPSTQAMIRRMPDENCCNVVWLLVVWPMKPMSMRCHILCMCNYIFIYASIYIHTIHMLYIYMGINIHTYICIYTMHTSEDSLLTPPIACNLQKKTIAMEKCHRQSFGADSHPHRAWGPCREILSHNGLTNQGVSWK